MQKIVFPSVLDYVRFQLLATPQAALLSNRDEADRQAAIKRVASETASFSDPEMLEGGAEALLTKPIDFDLLRNEIDGRIARAA